MDTEPLAFPALTTMLKAAGEATRLRAGSVIPGVEFLDDVDRFILASPGRLTRR